MKGNIFLFCNYFEIFPGIFSKVYIFRLCEFGAFALMSYKLVDADGAEVTYLSGFIPKIEADELFLELSNLEWKQEIISMFGKSILCPRKTILLGEKAGLSYRYSGQTKVSSEWSPSFSAMVSRISGYCGHPFNVALLNLYRDGNDYIGFHSDDEKDMELSAKIASVSFGLTRNFVLKHKKTKEEASIALCHGDLLVMGGTTQKLWKHSIPKLRRGVAATPRINVTLRYVRDQFLAQ